jgi:hypothetical protein
MAHSVARPLSKGIGNIRWGRTADVRLRKKQSDAIDGTTGGLDGNQRRRGGRGWGPFSGGQLTVIVVAVVVMMLFPVGAWAAYSVSHVTITDNTGARVANVDTKSNLDTATRDAVSGVAAKVNSLGQQLATVSGSVTVNGTTRVTDPLNSYTSHDRRVLGNGTNCMEFADAGHVLVVTSVSIGRIDVADQQSPLSVIDISRAVGDCATGFNGYSSTKSGAPSTTVGLQTVNFPSGLVIPDGTRLWVRDGQNGGSTFDISVNGYELPNSYCPPNPGEVVCQKGG